MKLTLKTDEGSICVNDMQDGEVAVITNWPPASMEEYTGAIVQRYKDALICLGKRSADCWSTIFKSRHEDCRVRLLKVGDIIRVE